MKIRIREKEKVIILDLEGNIDINASSFIETVGWALATRGKDILCNFEGVNLLDYVGVSVIAVACKNVFNHDGRIKVYNVPAHIRKVFDAVGLGKVLEDYNSEEAALHAFKEDKKIAKIMEMNLRRRFKRITLWTDIELKDKSSASSEWAHGKVLNLSGVGAFITSDHTFEVGTQVLCRIHLEPVPGVIEVEARVKWFAAKESISLESPAMGLEFDHIDSQKQREIIEFVEKNLTGNLHDDL